MTDKETNAAIATACGIKPVSNGYYLKHPTKEDHTLNCDSMNQIDVWKTRFPEKYADWLVIEDLVYPSYATDLNAMHDAEQLLINNGVQARYDDTLFRLLNTSDGVSTFDKIHATARQRAEAFLRTLGLFTE